MKVERIYLWGFMGAGKSSYGLKLARRLGWDFLDLDVFISSLEERSITEIFEQEGQDYFRRQEQNALRDIGDLKEVVVACGGGAPCFFENAKSMNANGLTIYLNVPFPFLYQRIHATSSSRPLLSSEKADVETLWEQRQIHYKKAHCIVRQAEHIHKELLPLLLLSGFNN